MPNNQVCRGTFTIKMPNWCNNTLTVSGKKKDIAEFKEKARGEKTALSFANFIPRPSILDDTRSPSIIVPTKNLEKEMIEVIKDGFSGYPITKKISEALIKKYGADNWYDWQKDNWGTKWDVEAELTDENTRHLEYNFDSAWCPPDRFIYKIAEMFPKLSFRLTFYEGGCAFKGEMEAENGEVTEDNTEDMTHEDFHEMGYYDGDDCEEEGCKL